MEVCEYASLVGDEVSTCGPSSSYITIGKCSKEITNHLILYKIRDDPGLRSEQKLLLARAGIFDDEDKNASIIICPDHRQSFGLRWRCNKKLCCIPAEAAGHKSKSAKGQCGLKSAESAFVLEATNILIPVGSPICKQCREKFKIAALSPLAETGAALERVSKKKAAEQLSSLETLTESFRDLTIDNERAIYSPETCSTASSSGESSGVGNDAHLAKRAKLNEFLEECSIQPLERPWLDWREVSERTKRRYVERTSEIVTSVLHVISPENASHLWGELQVSNRMNMVFGIGKSARPENAYLKALAEAYSNASSWDTRRQVLSIMAGVASFNTIAEYIPGINQYRVTIANLHRVEYGVNVPVPSRAAPRLKINVQQLDHFLSFITSPHLVQDLPFGEKHLQLSSGKTISVPNVIRTMIPQRIIMQYKQYCTEVKFKPFSESTMRRILDECSASIRKSLQGLDYYASDGARAFANLASLVQDISHQRDDGESRSSRIQEALKSGKLYLKGDYKVHISDESNVPDHCSVYALSDPSDRDLRKECSHSHTLSCDQCSALDGVLLEIEQFLDEASFENDEKRDESIYIFQSAKRAIQAWKGHQLRSVRQDQGRINALQNLNPETVLIVNDWAMKFLPNMYRESQQDWFGRRGISWHISVVFRKIGEDLQSQTFVHIVKTCAQDSDAVVVLLQHLLKSLKDEHPEIKRAYLRQDNAACYHSTSTVLALAQLKDSTGINISRLDFSDPQGGKGPADRMAATCKCHMRIYLNEGNDVTTAEEMKTAMTSHGGIEGVRVAVVEEIDGSVITDFQKIKGISKLNNFEYEGNCLTVWRAFDVGQGKSIPIENVSDTGSKWLSTGFSNSDFKVVKSKPKGKGVKPHEDTGPKTQAETGSNVNEKTEQASQPAIFSCPQEGCVRVFMRASSLERHLSMEKCTKVLEKKSMHDMAKEAYASRLMQGVGSFPSLAPTTSSQSTTSPLKEGWALKETKKAYRFNEKQKIYLKQKFNIGQKTKTKFDPEAVSKDMRRARNENGERLFGVSEFLSSRQIASFFSRLSAKLKNKEVTEEDINAAEEQMIYEEAREAILSSLQLKHPIVVDQYNICQLVQDNKLKSFKVALLQMLCGELELEVPSPPIRRKAPYVAILKECVEQCSCQN